MRCYDCEPHVQSGWAASQQRQHRNSSDSVGIYRCPRPDVCRADGLKTYASCANGTTGKFCAACARGFYRSRSTRSCLSCSLPVADATSIWIAFGVASAAQLFALLDGAELVDQAGVKIMLGYLQVMSQLGSVLNLDYEAMLPSFSLALKHAGSVFFSVSDVFRRIHCKLDFYQLFFASVHGIPLVLLLLVWLKYWLVDRRRLIVEQAHTSAASRPSSRLCSTHPSRTRSSASSSVGCSRRTRLAGLKLITALTAHRRSTSNCARWH